MSEMHQLTDVCFESVIEWLLTHASITVLGDTQQFFDGIHAIVAVTVHEAVEQQRSRLIRCEPSVN